VRPCGARECPLHSPFLAYPNSLPHRTSLIPLSCCAETLVLRGAQAQATYINHGARTDRFMMDYNRSREKRQSHHEMCAEQRITTRKQLASHSSHHLGRSGGGFLPRYCTCMGSIALNTSIPQGKGGSDGSALTCKHHVHRPCAAIYGSVHSIPMH